MLLTVSTTHRPATDLGYLLHKHPDRVHGFEQAFGTATVFYPEATGERCTAALVLEVDPVRLVRSRPQGSPDFSLAQYVNDRPYAASSLLAVALRRVFSTARSGRCDARPELAATPMPLELRLPALPCRPGGEAGRDLLRRIFEPLGWTVEARDVPLDETLPQWGHSRYLDLTLTGEAVLADALNQLHVLLPALDQSKHYWQAPDEVDKLLRSGGEWLATHPERALITHRYLGRRRALAREALSRLDELEGRADDLDERTVEPGAAVEPGALVEPAETRPLNQLRREAVLGVLDELAAAGASSVIDLGCGGGQLLAEVLARPAYAVVAGADVSSVGVLAARRRLGVDDRALRRTGERQAEALLARIRVFQASLTYTDERFAGYDAAVLMEVVEHLDPERLPALERVVFAEARPGAVVVTTPNADYNVRYPALAGFRHPDHRFEWSRAEFADWCEGVAARHGYTVERGWAGEVDADLGAPTQTAVFRRG